MTSSAATPKGDLPPCGGTTQWNRAAESDSDYGLPPEKPRWLRRASARLLLPPRPPKLSLGGTARSYAELVLRGSSCWLNPRAYLGSSAAPSSTARGVRIEGGPLRAEGWLALPLRTEGGRTLQHWRTSTKEVKTSLAGTTDTSWSIRRMTGRWRNAAAECRWLQRARLRQPSGQPGLTALRSTPPMASQHSSVSVAGDKLWL